VILVLVTLSFRSHY